MPIDISGRRKLYPDGMFGFRWEHELSGTVNANTFKSLGKVTGEGEQNHSLAKAKGYSIYHNDWRDVEQKIYFDSSTATGSQYITLYMGGLGSEANPCAGYAYEAQFNMNGIVRIRKKMYHIQYYTIASKDNGPLPVAGELKGVAFCRYNINGNRNVRLEAWVDKGDHGFWKKILSVVDTGFNFGRAGGRCNGTDKEAFTWGFPLVAFRAPFDYTFENMTARVINPGGSFNESGSGGGKARPRGGGGSTPLPIDHS